MRLRVLPLVGLAMVICAVPLVAQPGNLSTSLHGTRLGKDFWYRAENGGFEGLTGVSIEELRCMECHGSVDANGNPYPDPFVNPGGPDSYCQACHPSSFFPVSEGQCYSCHGRQRAETFTRGYSDVHRDAGMVCWDCHGTEDMHGDGTEYVSMLEAGAIDAECEDCHAVASGTIPADHDDYDPHGGALHCKACHTQSVISCYNCHFESQVEAHLKRARTQVHDFVMLVNREEDGKVHPATFQSLTYQGKAFVAFAPYSAHTITGDGRECDECHNWAGTNATINDYNEDLQIEFATEQVGPAGLLWKHGIVPIPEDYQQTFKMDFLTYTGDPSDPVGPSPLWEPIGKNTWDGSQMFFATPLTRDQMNALGFAFRAILDIKPGSCPNSVGAKSKGVVSVALVGTDSLDVYSIDPASLELEGVSALRYAFEDVTTPVVDGECGCGEDGHDGYVDLTAKFSTRALVEAIGESASSDGTLLSMTGRLMDGTPFVARDCLVLR